MTYEEYVLAQRSITIRIIATLIGALNPFRVRALSPSAWTGLLAGMYRLISSARTESAVLAREFYDSERAAFLGDDEPRHDLFLAGYDTDWFYEALEPARETFSRPNATEASRDHLIGRAIKEVENAGRRTVLRAVDTDPRVEGWARVEGGNESCAFCLMLISRGPVYKEARTAGLNADKVSAVEIFKRADRTGNDDALMALMSRWHENCDCKVVPVFDRKNWTGRESYLAAERIWIDAAGSNSSEKLESIRKLLASRAPREQDSPQPSAA